MNRQEHLLIKLIEECAEVQKAAAKALEFGLENKNPDTRLSNAKEIAHELDDVMAIVQMLRPGFTWIIDYDAIAMKKAKVERYMQQAIACGTLEKPKSAPVVKYTEDPLKIIDKSGTNHENNGTNVV